MQQIDWTTGKKKWTNGHSEKQRGGEDSPVMKEAHMKGKYSCRREVSCGMSMRPREPPATTKPLARPSRLSK